MIHIFKPYQFIGTPEKLMAILFSFQPLESMIDQVQEGLPKAKKEKRNEEKES